MRIAQQPNQQTIKPDNVMKKTRKLLMTLLSAMPIAAMYGADVRFINNTDGVTAARLSNVVKIVLNQSAAEVTASDGKTTRVENSAFNCFTINKNAGTTSIDTAHGDGMTLSINGNILTATSAQGVDRMELITPDGRTVAAYSGRSRQATIDVGSCRAGIYIVKASSGKHTTTKKIIIK